ncbi:MAG: diacylglycerol kinase family lipid kinase [Chloroflexota bacterium]|nr:diacylglycerol kinase family lipid kinase [Dehalococcoidia bacterium]MDW8254124.1 diacylglycerol kinase family lipid kinase [Chloroflexota bacterium]
MGRPGENVRVVVIVNPASGSARGVDLPAAMRVFAAAGWTVEMSYTAAPGDATQAAAAAATAGADLVIVSGGDGTVNEALQPLVGTGTALGVLPAGTANLLARELRLPLRATEAAQALVHGSRRVVDVGRAGGQRYFLLFAGVGFDAEVVHAVDVALKRALGALSFVAAAAQVMPRYRGAPADILLDGRRLRRHALMVVVANTRLFALFPLTPEARAHDGRLDVVVFHGVGWWAKVRHLLSVVFLRTAAAPNVDRARVRSVEIRSSVPLPVELDGEPWGETPMRFEVVPAAVAIWAPPTAPEELFGRAERAGAPAD